MRKSRNQSAASAFYVRGGRLRGLEVRAWEGLSSMVNHLARAEEMRDRAKQCQEFASQTTSEKFADCYRLLSQNYAILATVEHEFFAREMERSRAATAAQLARVIDRLSGDASAGPR
jgi:hypothetical protein